MKHLLIALALALPGAAHAVTAAVVPTLDTPSGSRVNAVAATSLVFLGAQVYRLEVSTPADTPVLLLAGAGQLYSVNCGSGTSSGYMLSFDSATSAGITVATLGKSLHAPLYSPGQASATTNNGRLDLAAAPAQFANGLVAITHGAALNCYIEARLNTGVNPGP